LLSYLWFAGWGDGVFDDYHPFHHKMVAWKTKDNLVNAEIEELRELDHPDETLFAVKEATPPSDQIGTDFVDGTEFLKQVGKLPDLNWPEVSGPPITGTVKLRIVTDRYGRVREARGFLSSNPDLTDWLAGQALGWQFKPYLVDGVPVQVDTTLLLEFKTELKPGAANLADAAGCFHRAAALGGLRVEGAKPFHLVASFRAFGYEDLLGKGTYEEYWLSPTEWKREASLAGHTVTESRSGDLGYRKFNQAFAPLRIDEAIDTISAVLPQAADPSRGPRWQVSKSELGKTPLIRVSRGSFGDNGKLDVSAVAYYFDPDNGLLRGFLRWSDLTLYNDFLDFSGKMVAREMTVVENSYKILEISIDKIEPAPPLDGGNFTIHGVEPVSYAKGNPGIKFAASVPIKKVLPVFAPAVRANLQHGRTVCRLLLDAHGHVRDVTFPNGVDPALESAFRAAALQWEYSPSTMNGHPIEASVTVNFDY
jgi:Gram-negative bacterial TonB protein C-terminal